MKRPTGFDKFQFVSRAHGQNEANNKSMVLYASNVHLSTQGSVPPAESSSDDDSSQSSEDSFNKYTEECEQSPANVKRLFPPPNPLPPKALMFLKEPLRLGADVPLM